MDTELHTSKRRTTYLDKLFDSDGLPWTSRLGWEWLLVMCFFTGNLIILPFGIYLGLWIKDKGRSSVPLYIFVSVTVLFIATLVPSFKWIHGYTLDAISGAILAGWFAGAFTLRYEVRRYYADAEGWPIHINLFFTALFSACWISYCVRANYPLDRSGKLAPGLLKLTD